MSLVTNQVERTRPDDRVPEVAGARVERRARQERWTPWLLLAPCLLVILVVGIYPLLYSFWISFYAYHPTNPSFPSGFVFLDNYLSILSDKRALHSFGLTFTFATIDVALTTILGLGLALWLNKSWPGLALLRGALLVPMFLTPIAVGITWRIMFQPDLGILNHILRTLGLDGPDWLGDPSNALSSVLIVDIWQWTPFMFLILFAGVRSLPRSPVEAANIDGATAWQIFWLVLLPLLKPVILLAVILRFIDAFRTFDQIFMMTRGGPNHATDLMSLYLYRVNFKFFDIGYGAAVSWTFLAMLLLVTVLLLRIVRRS